MLNRVSNDWKRNHIVLLTVYKSKLVTLHRFDSTLIKYDNVTEYKNHFDQLISLDMSLFYSIMLQQVRVILKNRIWWSKHFSYCREES